MCGFTGFWTTKSPEYDMKSVASQMVSSIYSRGPDAQDVWLDQTSGIALAHARLAVVDLSPTGAQPMHSYCGRYMIAYNGEVYNASELREELKIQGINCQGSSDTQVIIDAISAWGFAETIERLIGMFALAVWDKQDKLLFLARDRVGIKPLYWGKCGDTWFFGSQLKSFCRHPKFNPQTNLQAVQSFLQFTYVPAPMSIYQDIHKLLPGHYVVIDGSGQSKTHCYWDINSVAMSGIKKSQSDFSELELLQQTEDLLTDAVARRMVADVPLGAFLSGGIDSSLVVALMQSMSTSPIKTFSIGFTDPSYNEADHAKMVAQHLKTDHNEVYLNPAQAQQIIPQLPQWYDEPFADSSQIPTYLVSKIAREEVTVSLSGDGGDELFGGYTRYAIGQQIWGKLQRLPLDLRKLIAGGIELISPAAWDTLSKILPDSKRPRHMGDKAYKLAKILRKRSAEQYYQALVSAWQTPPVAAEVKGTGFTQPNKLDPAQDFLAWMQLQDILTYLPDDILAKVDRASMAVSLEARVPLLDHRIVEHSWQLPRSMKVRDGQGKWALRQVLYKHVPRELVERPKMGFGVPVGEWIADDKALRPWAEELLSKKMLSEHGVFDVPAIRKVWQAHLSGQTQATAQLWAVLMFQAWTQTSI